jgi:hypothetical protein
MSLFHQLKLAKKAAAKESRRSNEGTSTDWGGITSKAVLPSISFKSKAQKTGAGGRRMRFRKAAEGVPAMEKLLNIPNMETIMDIVLQGSTVAAHNNVADPIAFLAKYLLDAAEKQEAVERERERLRLIHLEVLASRDRDASIKRSAVRSFMCWFRCECDVRNASMVHPISCACYAGCTKQPLQMELLHTRIERVCIV